ncbi:MAG: GDSL-type esterase/lipase family protein [Bacteroidota bacterium]
MNRRYLALGDSYTIGEGVLREGTWPHQLAARLGDRVDPPEVIAQTGWTTDELDAAITEADPRGPFALVTLLIGVNDQYRGRAVDSYRAGFNGLLERAVGFAGGEARRVVVASIPDWGRTAFQPRDDRERTRDQITREVDTFNATAREITEVGGAAWVDLTPLSRTQGAMTVADDLHPTAEAYAAWTDLLLPAARVALR